MKNIPWVEKYRPVKFENIILDPVNRTLFENIISKKYFPNLLFYGPPGTGKTTTIINLINEYQIKYNERGKGSVIHLNASDERGIDIIRSQINQFVKSNSMFESSYKFVILDEVDYMTKNAQQALKYLLQTSTYNVRFCLICNYISKIDESLQHEFICVRFNQLPKQDIHSFIKNICQHENIEITTSDIETIQYLFHSDVRSMINFIQLNVYSVKRCTVASETKMHKHLGLDERIGINQFAHELQNTHIHSSTDETSEQRDVNKNLSNWNTNIISLSTWETFHRTLFRRTMTDTEMFLMIHTMSIQYNMDKKNIIQNYFHFIIRNKLCFRNIQESQEDLLSNLSTERLTEFFLLVKNIIHTTDIPIEMIIQYFISHIRKFYQKLEEEADPAVGMETEVEG